MRKRLLKETNGIRLKTVKRDQWHIMNAFDTMAWPYVPVCQVLLLSLESSLEGNNKSWCVCSKGAAERTRPKTLNHFSQYVISLISMNEVNIAIHGSLLLPS